MPPCCPGLVLNSILEELNKISNQQDWKKIVNSRLVPIFKLYGSSLK